MGENATPQELPIAPAELRWMIGQLRAMEMSSEELAIVLEMATNELTQCERAADEVWANRLHAEYQSRFLARLTAMAFAPEDQDEFDD